MESYAAVEMQDYWNEVRTIGQRRTSSHSNSHSEEEARSHDDDGESDEHFLEELGISVKQDSELSEDNITCHKFMGALNPRQEEALKRRVRTLNATIRRKKQRNKPDIRNFFANTDNSSTGTRSRSATPDSLDSVSPPRTPPDPHPKSWVDPYLSRSRGSLDSGNHSLVTSPSVITTPGPFSPINDHSNHHHHNRSLAAGVRRHSPSGENNNRSQWMEERPVHLYRAPSVDMLPKVASGVPGSGKELRRQRSYARDLARDVKNFHSKQGLYEFYPKALQAEHDIQVLGYRYIGSVHIPHAKCKEKRPSIESNASHYSQDLESSTDSRRPSVEIRKTHSVSHSRDHRDRGKIRENQENIENRRTGSSTDLGFKVKYLNPDDEFPELLLETSRCGQTRMDWLDEPDLSKLVSLALLELDIIFTEHHIHHRWRKLKKRKPNKEETNVFGVPLESLLERDRIYLPDSTLETSVPVVFYKLAMQLERQGMHQEGIMRVPGHRSQTEQLRRTLDSHFYTSLPMAETALRGAAPNDVATLVKSFLRELPQPLLTHTYMPAFYKTHRIDNIGERVLALTMLILLLPTQNRDTLHAVLELCARIVSYEEENKMTLYNVAMIMAPNLFLPSNHRSKLQLRSEDKEQQLNHEMTYANVTTKLTQAMIKYRDVLWTVPHRLISQIRRLYQAEALKHQNYTPMRRLLTRKSKETIQRPIENEVDYQDGVLRVSAPQFNKIQCPVKLDPLMTARDLLTRFIEELTLLPENPRRVEGRREQQYKRGTVGSNSNPPSSSQMATMPQYLACLLSGSLKNVLKQHALHERGGNIGDRRLDPNAKLLTIYQDNPNAEFLVKCHHLGGEPPRKQSLKS
ncbi:rho GTPase-activating protein 18-like isoform X3 [Palaemon carinicauda]|uniref:rho GTPase-activating protein 18-like isoform X3 n=1 Tax=Palaemon carinicauda TaxID=392227 RepID=UPI0035B68BC9